MSSNLPPAPRRLISAPSADDLVHVRNIAAAASTSSASIKPILSMTPHAQTSITLTPMKRTHVDIDLSGDEPDTNHARMSEEESEAPIKRQKLDERHQATDTASSVVPSTDESPPPPLIPPTSFLAKPIGPFTKFPPSAASVHPTVRLEPETIGKYEMHIVPITTASQVHPALLSPSSRSKELKLGFTVSPFAMKQSAANATVNSNTSLPPSVMIDLTLEPDSDPSSEEQGDEDSEDEPMSPLELKETQKLDAPEDMLEDLSPQSIPTKPFIPPFTSKRRNSIPHAASPEGDFLSSPPSIPKHVATHPSSSHAAVVAAAANANASAASAASSSSLARSSQWSPPPSIFSPRAPRRSSQLSQSQPLSQSSDHGDAPTRQRSNLWKKSIDIDLTRSDGEEEEEKKATPSASASSAKATGKPAAPVLPRSRCLSEHDDSTTPPASYEGESDHASDLHDGGEEEEEVEDRDRMIGERYQAVIPPLLTSLERECDADRFCEKPLNWDPSRPRKDLPDLPDEELEKIEREERMANQLIEDERLARKLAKERRATSAGNSRSTTPIAATPVSSTRRTRPSRERTPALSSTRERARVDEPKQFEVENILYKKLKPKRAPRSRTGAGGRRGSTSSSNASGAEGPSHAPSSSAVPSPPSRPYDYLYHVSWVGYPPEENTFEPYENVRAVLENMTQSERDAIPTEEEYLKMHGDGVQRKSPSKRAHRRPREKRRYHSLDSEDESDGSRGEDDERFMVHPVSRRGFSSVPHPLLDPDAMYDESDTDLVHNMLIISSEHPLSEHELEDAGDDEEDDPSHSNIPQGNILHGPSHDPSGTMVEWNRSPSQIDDLPFEFGGGVRFSVAHSRSELVNDRPMNQLNDTSTLQRFLVRC